MWIKLTGEYINLAHIVRVRANKGFRNGREEWVAELEGVFKGELQSFTRYRGVDAEILLNALDQQQLTGAEPLTTTVTTQALTSTLHDVKF